MPSNTKRVLFVTPPGHGHAFPIVSIAWSLRLLCLEVLVATCGISLQVLRSAGLPVIDVAPNIDLTEIYERFKTGFDDSSIYVRQKTRINQPSACNVENVFTVLANITVDDIVHTALAWKPDLIIYTPEAIAGAIAATRCGIPSLFLGLGLIHDPKLMQAWRSNELVNAFSRHRISELESPIAWIDVVPSSLRTGQSGSWPMKYVPFCGNAKFEDRIPGHSRKQRIAVTFGTVVPYIRGTEPIRRILPALGDVDAEFVIASGSLGRKPMSGLPPNVSDVGWLPFDILFPGCAGVIHHGGSGTSLAALFFGLPQIIVPYGSDQLYNATVLSKRGAALAVEGENVDAAVVMGLLKSVSLRQAALEVSMEMSRMPTPAKVAADIVRDIF